MNNSHKNLLPGLDMAGEDFASQKILTLIIL